MRRNGDSDCKERDLQARGEEQRRRRRERGGWKERRNGRQWLLLLSDCSSRAGVGGEDTGETDSEEGPPVAIFQGLVYPGLSPASGSFPKCYMGRKEGEELLSSSRRGDSGCVAGGGR